jgi:hypothetical protein
MSNFKTYLHKGCSGKTRASNEWWDGIYFYGLLEVVCSIMGEGSKTQIGVVHNPEEYAYPEITEIRCHDCGESVRKVSMPALTLESRIGHDPESYGLVYCESSIEQP